MPIHTSPFPTTHDTIGASTLDSPTRLPSSPPSADKDDGNESPRVNELAITDLDKRLSQYTVDWNKFAGGVRRDIQDADEDDPGPEFGGPEDFTFNIDQYLNGSTPLPNRQSDADDLDAEEDMLPDSPSPRPRHHHHHEEGEESEFGPPVDMSTPSHLMWRKNASLGRGEETRLEDIEETFPSSPEKEDGKGGNGLEESRTFTTVLREIEYLHEQRRDRDEKIRQNEKKLASITEEVEFLREELQRKSSLLTEANAKVGEEAALREQLKQQHEQNEKRATSDEDDARELVKLRKELEDARDQLKKRDEALEESGTKLSELTASSELRQRQKNTEIEDLKAQINERELEITEAEDEMAEMKGQYDIFKDRIDTLETRNSPLEEKNILLEKELNLAKVELVAQKNALSNLATELSIEIERKEYKEIVSSIQRLFQERKKSDQGSSTEIEELKGKLDKAQSSLQQHAADKQLAEAEWRRSQDLLGESRSLITTIEGENTRLAAQIQELKSSLTKTREETNLLKEQPPPPVIQTPNNSDQINALHESHRAETQTLRDTHMHATRDLHTSYNDTIRHLRSLLSATEKRESELHNQLLTTQSSTSSQSNEIASLKTQVQQLQSTLALKEEASADMDKLIARSIEKREREWERRTEVLLKERDKMGKALMWAWGEKEVGKTSSSSRHAKKSEGAAEPAGEKHEKHGQGYRYKYVVRS
jgi:DNA repair exonuclease SbcCD ATPase subunit